MVKNALILIFINLIFAVITAAMLAWQGGQP